MPNAYQSWKKTSSARKHFKEFKLYIYIINKWADKNEGAGFGDVIKLFIIAF